MDELGLAGYLVTDPRGALDEEVAATEDLVYPDTTSGAGLLAELALHGDVGGELCFEVLSE